MDTITRSVNQTAKTLMPVKESVHVETVKDPLDLEGLPLQSNIMPPPGTKVTTTVRTYTYEIPGDNLPAPSPTNQTVVYKTTSHNNTLRSNTTTLDRNRPERDIPGNESHIYRNETYNNTTNHYGPDGGYPETDRPTLSRPGPGKNVTYIHETYNTTNHLDGPPENDRPFPVPGNEPPPVNKTVVYKRNVRDTTTTYPGSNRPTSPLNGYPPNTNVEIYKEDVTNTTNNLMHPPGGPSYPPPQNGHGPDGPPTTTYYYKHESTNTTNRRYGPPGSANSPRTNEPPALLPANEPLYPREPGTVTYKYSSQTTSKNTNRYPDETDNLIKPAPFPVTQRPYTPNPTTPKRLEDLLSNFDDVSGVWRYFKGHADQFHFIAFQTPQRKGYHEQNLLPDKPYTASPDSLVETANNDQKVPTKNVAGPPVYYPPGEVTLKREEKGAGWQAQVMD